MYLRLTNSPIFPSAFLKHNAFFHRKKMVQFLNTGLNLYSRSSSSTVCWIRRLYIPTRKSKPCTGMNCPRGLERQSTVVTGSSALVRSAIKVRKFLWASANQPFSEYIKSCIIADLIKTTCHGRFWYYASAIYFRNHSLFSFMHVMRNCFSIVATSICS